MSLQACPPPELLASFCDGQIDDEDSLQIGSHIDECTRCQGSMATFLDQSYDVLLLRLRYKAGSRDPFGAEPMCRQVVDRVARQAATGEFLPSPVCRSNATTEIPDFVGSYRVLRLLGQGGMGTVYQALHVELDKVVAIKLLPERWARNDAVVSRFQREMKAVGKLQHPNIVAAHDAGQVNGTHYLVMEFVAGVDLSELARRHGVLGIPEACELIRQAASGLEHAARRGLVHRDIKPSNLMLMLDDDGQPLVKVLDLGLALLADSGSVPDAGKQLTDLTGFGQIMGTIDYMAPEQAIDSHDVDVRADIYSLGATLCKLLTGEIPFSRISEASVARKLAALAYESVPSITLSRPDLPPGLAQLIDSMLARNPEHRPSTPGEVAKRLAPFAEGCRLEGLLAPTPFSETETGDFCHQTLVSPKPAWSVPETVVPVLSSPPPGEVRTDPAPRPAFFRSRIILRIFTVALALAFLFGVWNLSQTYFIQTAEGVVVLEVKDPGVNVTLGEKSFTIENSGKKYVISAGSHTLKIDHDGQTYETGKFNLSSGKTEIFKVQLLPGKVLVLKGDVELAAKQVDPVAKVPSSSVPRTAKSIGSAAAVSATQLSSLNPVDIHTSPDWEWTVPERLGPEINSDGHESFPHLSSDGLRLWIQRDFFSTTDRAWVSERKSPDKPWTQAKSVGRPFELNGPMADVFVSRDELTWMFVTWDDRVTPQIMESTRSSREDPWSTPKAVAEAGIPSQFPVLTDDGLTLYLMKNFLGIEGDEICVMTRPTKSAPWTAPVSLGAPVNSLADERPVWVSSDHLVLIFHAAGGNRTSPRQFDLWLTSRASLTSPWQEPVSFGPVVNSSSREASACLSADGRELIFESERPGSQGTSDLYVSRRVPKQVDTTSLLKAIAPFDSDHAKACQVAWASHLGVPVDYTNSIGMKFVLIPPGEFTMGSTPAEIAAAPSFPGEDDYWLRCARREGPQHRVVLTQPFYFATHETTQATYAKIMGHNPSALSPQGSLKDRVNGLDTSNFPVETVNWHEASEFCDKLSALEGLQPTNLKQPAGEVAIIEGNGYRLPTEAEWEFACRAGTTTQFWSGDRLEDLNAACWHGSNSEHRTHEVGGVKANPFGLYDIHGNVWEWVLDAWDVNSAEQFTEFRAFNPLGSANDTDRRIVRGGFWATPEARCSSGRRFAQPSRSKYGHNGFRVVLSVPALK